MRKASPTTPHTSCGSRWLASTISPGTRTGYKHIQEQGYEALTIESHVRYLKPVPSTIASSIHARCGDIRGARFRYEYAVTWDDELVADGWTSHAVVDAKTMRPARFPAWLAEAVAGAETRARRLRIGAGGSVTSRAGLFSASASLGFGFGFGFVPTRTIFFSPR